MGVWGYVGGGGGVCVCVRVRVCVCACVCVCEGWQKNILEIYARVFKCAEFLYL